MDSYDFTHRTIAVEHHTVEVVEAGTQNAQTIVLLHGWPQDWATWREVIMRAKETAHVVAVNLPGIGESTPTNGEKADIARVIHQALQEIMHGKFVLVGHDIGAMVAFAYARQFPHDLAAAVLMDAAIPGIAPWEKVLANPYIWHFAFHAIPELPETLVAGKQRAYFNFFFDALTKDKGAIDDAARNHYASVYKGDALQAGFDWYRAFATDAKSNAQDKHELDLPFLYIRGEAEGGEMKEYLDGFREAGLTKVTGVHIPNSAHFTPEENPESVWQAIADFAARFAA